MPNRQIVPRLVSARSRAFCMAIGAVVLLGLAAGSPETSALRQRRILEDIKYLASDELEGRGVGSRGLELAAQYIREQFQKAGLKPGLPDENYTQNFEMLKGTKLGEANRLLIRGPKGQSMELAVTEEFIPLVASQQEKFDAPMVFAGYGITAPEYAYDDYADIDVTGKVVLVMRHEPRQTDKPDPQAPFRGNMDTQHAFFRQKLSNAVKHGAVAVLFVSDPHMLQSQPDRLMELGSAAGLSNAQIPLIHLSRATGDVVLQSALGKDLRALEAAIDKDLKPQSARLDGWSCSGQIVVEKELTDVANIVGVLEGAGPQAGEALVLGAHYDHLGYGGRNSLAPGTHQIHHGADDNASGTSGLLELARRLAQRDKPLARRLVFVAFTGEEMGLFGSQYYVTHPIIPLEQTVAMINLDMIGRLREDKLTIYGTGTAREFVPLIESLNRERHFAVNPVAAGAGSSDQDSFWPRKIPVLHFFTGNHGDYHRPGDQWEKVSVEGMDRVISLVEDVVVALANSDSRPEFVEVPAGHGSRADQPRTGGERASLGSRPSYTEEVDGVLLEGVAPGGPAEKAGVRGGDIIVQVGDMEVHDIYDLQAALESHRPGDFVRVTVRRGTLRITYPVTLGGRAE